MSIYDEAVLIQKPSGYKAAKLYNVIPSPQVSEQSSVEFDGVDDYLNAGDDEIFNYGTGEFTTSVWVNFASISATQSIIGRVVDGNNAEYME